MLQGPSVKKELPTKSAGALLEAAYRNLGYDEGSLIAATDSANGLEPSDWIEKGEWLALAKKVNAERIFFVENNPVIVFAQCREDEHQLRFQQIWNMARPPLLFLASPGELAVLDLTHGPAETPDDWEATILKRRLHVVKEVSKVASELAKYRREQVESGRLFEEVRFGDEQRADRALVADLKVIRRELMADGGLDARYAHAIIGRSIFIRYLEDRNILVPEYFRRIARRNKRWQKLLDTPVSGIFMDEELRNRLYLRVLRNKQFTYALFEQLAMDFNGDMFPEDHGEEKAIKQSHLDVLQQFLCGNPDPNRPRLFFFAYRFDIIPIELISSIYEEFYGAGLQSTVDGGTHYTPPALVEFLLSQVLTPEQLAMAPRVLDPACGSGIFIVEAFRRIVRYRVQVQGRRLNRRELLKILREQIAGMDINEEAIRVAAFSLYLAFLHYQEPPDILAQIKAKKRLPNLKYEARRSRVPEQHFNTLLACNAFDIESKISPSDKDVIAAFSSNCASIVVGNPPWGSPGTKPEERQAREAMDVTLSWCEKHQPRLEVGDREWSQAFIHKICDLLQDGGQAGLLVSAGVLFKSHEKSQAFRKQWLRSVKLHCVVNFSHVRDVFFKGKARKTGAQAPFISVTFTKREHDSGNLSFEYWSAKKTAMVEGTQAVVLSKPDLHRLAQQDVMRDDNLWKIFWWGSHRDNMLVQRLQMELPLEDTVIRDVRLRDDNFGQGYILGQSGKREPCEELQAFKVLPTKAFRRYGAARLKKKTGQESFYRRGNFRLYKGTRLLVKRGIAESGSEKGQIVARLATQPFRFNSSIHGLRLPDSSGAEAKILLGICWSSLARYYFWLTAGSWMWHNEIHLEDLRHLPIRLPENKKLAERIVSIVDKLRVYPGEDLFANSDVTESISELERRLDEAIFDLYELSPSERDQIMDMCEYGLDLFYNHTHSEAMKPIAAGQPAKRSGVLSNLSSSRSRKSGLNNYLRAFLDIWNRELEPTGEFSYQVICPKSQAPMLAVVFETQEKSKPLEDSPDTHDDAWERVLAQLSESLIGPIGCKRIYIDGMVRVVTDTDIIIIKRNEQRLWTASMAREDAEATLLQAMHLQEAAGRA